MLCVDEDAFTGKRRKLNSKNEDSMLSEDFLDSHAKLMMEQQSRLGKGDKKSNSRIDIQNDDSEIMNRREASRVLASEEVFVTVAWLVMRIMKTLYIVVNRD